MTKKTWIPRPLAVALTVGAVASAGLMSTASSASAVSTGEWKETTLVNDASVDGPQQILADGDYRLVPMSTPQSGTGTLAVYDSEGVLLDSIEVGFQPRHIVKAAPSTYWVAINSGVIKQVKFDGSKLRLTGKQVTLGSGYTTTLANVGKNQIAATMDDGKAITFASFDTVTESVTKKVSAGTGRAGNYGAFASGLYWTTTVDSDTGTYRLVGIAPSTGEIARSTEIDGSPQGMSSDKEGDLWMVDSAKGTLTEFKGSTGTVLRMVSVPHGDDHYPLGLAYDPATNQLAASIPSGFSGESGVVTVDAASGTISSDTRLSGDYPSALTFTSSGSLWTANLRHSEGQNPGGTISILTRT